MFTESLSWLSRNKEERNVGKKRLNTLFLENVLDKSRKTKTHCDHTRAVFDVSANATTTFNEQQQQQQMNNEPETLSLVERLKSTLMIPSKG